MKVLLLSKYRHLEIAEVETPVLSDGDVLIRVAACGICGSDVHGYDWGPHGITVNCLAPGWFKTDQNKALYESPGWVEYLCDRIPVKRPGQPEDLEAAVVFLAAESSRYVTGQTLLVDGGISTGAVRAMTPSERGGAPNA